MSVAIHIKDAVKKYGENVIIPDLSLSIREGEFFTLLGPSGCGKTTLLRMIAGFNSIEGGDFYFNDRRINELDPAKRNIGMVFQNYAIFPHLNVRKNVEFGLRNKKFPKDQIAAQADKFMQLMQIDQFADRMPERLSGGQQQRVALARALVARPQVLLLDEPLSNLDAKLRESMRFEIKEIQARLGITVVYVTHDQTEAMAMSDRVILINRGVVQQVASPADIYDHPANQFVADFLGKVVFLKGNIAGGRIVLDNTNQSIAYDGDKTGRVELALRPERISISLDGGELEGVLESQYYLGDVDDCRVKVGDVTVRVIAPPETYHRMKLGDKVYLTFREKLIFDEDGSLDDKLKIMT